MGTLHETIGARKPVAGRILLGSLCFVAVAGACAVCWFLACKPAGDKTTMKGGSKDTPFPGCVYGQWVVKVVIPRFGQGDSERQKMYVGKAITIGVDSIDCVFFSATKPLYKLDIIRCSDREGEVPSRAFRRTSAFELYEQGRTIVYQVDVYQRKGEYCGAFEFLREKGQVLVMGDDCLLIAERAQRH